MTTVRELVTSTIEVVGDAQHARWIVAEAVATDDLDAVINEAVTERMVAHLDSMVARYRTGEPLQYVLGRWSFRYLDLAVDRRVLIPRPETELVAGIAIDLALAVGEPRRVVDLGTGSGAIGLSLAYELPLDGTEVWITDIDDDALDVARANLAGLGRSARNVRVLRSDWFDELPSGFTAHVIVSNPPYVAEHSPLLDASVVQYEPARALFGGSDGLVALRTIIETAPRYLVEGGWLVLEIGADQGVAVKDLLADAGYHEIALRTDLAGLDRVAIGRAPVSRS